MGSCSIVSNCCRTCFFPRRCQNASPRIRVSATVRSHSSRCSLCSAWLLNVCRFRALFFAYLTLLSPLRLCSRRSVLRGLSFGSALDSSSPRRQQAVVSPLGWIPACAGMTLRRRVFRTQHPLLALEAVADAADGFDQVAGFAHLFAEGPNVNVDGSLQSVGIHSAAAVHQFEPRE